MGVASFLDDYQNYIAVIGLQDEHVLVEDDFADYPDFVTLAETYHGYPATSLQWQPTTAASHTWSQKSSNTEFLATTADALRVWEYSNDGTADVSSYVGRQPTNPGNHSLTMKIALSGVCILRRTNFHTIVFISLTAIQSSEPVHWRSLDQLLLERKITQSDSHFFN
jgi:WD repeat-containing protein 68